MTLHNFRILFLFLAVLFAGPAQSSDGLPICFMVGAGNGEPQGLERMKKTLNEQGIEFHSFRPGKKGTVIERAQSLARLVEAKIEKNPRFRCHAFAYSMGGLVSRYSYHHVRLNPSNSWPRGFDEVFMSITTFSSPHQGTPLAAWLKRYAPGYSLGVDDLSEENTVKYNSPDFPETFSPPPVGIPNFSYLTFMESKDEAMSFISKAGFQIIESIYEDRGWESRSDGVVPLISQPYGRVVAAVQAEHEYFDDDIGLRPWAGDIYTVHWQFLEGKLDSVNTKSLGLKKASELLRRDDMQGWGVSKDFVPMLSTLF